MVFLISHISASDEPAEGKDDASPLHEVSSETLNPERDIEETEKESKEEEENEDQEHQGEEWSMHN